MFKPVANLLCSLVNDMATELISKQTDKRKELKNLFE